MQSYWYLNGLERIYEAALIQLFNKCIFAALIIFLINENSSIGFIFYFMGLEILRLSSLPINNSKKYKKFILFVSFKSGIQTLKIVQNYSLLL